MGLFSKKEENKIPELPQLPNTGAPPTAADLNQQPGQPPAIPGQPPTTPEQPNNSTLPSFPTSNLGENMNQNAIKDAVGENPPAQPAIPGQPPTNPGQPDPLALPPIQPNPNQPPEQITPQNPRKSMTQEAGGKLDMSNMEPSGFIEGNKGNTMEMKEWEEPAPEEKNHKTTHMKRNEPLFIELGKFEETLSSFDEIKLKVSEIESLLRTIKKVKSDEEDRLNHWEGELQAIKARLDQIDQEIFSKI